MWLHLAGGRDTLVRGQSDATSASFTIVNFEVDDIDEAVDALTSRSVGVRECGSRDLDGRLCSFMAPLG